MKSVVINSDKSIGYIEEYKGHALLNVREWDPGTAVKPEGVYVLEFSDDKPIQDQLFTYEEQNALWEAINQVVVERENNHAFDAAINLVCRRVFYNAYRQNEERPERPQIELRREDGLL